MGNMAAPNMNAHKRMVKQRYKYDCLLAVLCMVAGKPYEELWGDTDFPRRAESAGGCSGELLDSAYTHAGISREDRRSVYAEDLPPRAKEGILFGCRAIVQVPSLNVEGGSHFVYWDGETVFDPSNEQQYRWFNQIAVAAEFITVLKQKAD